MSMSPEVKELLEFFGKVMVIERGNGVIRHSFDPEACRKMGYDVNYFRRLYELLPRHFKLLIEGYAREVKVGKGYEPVRSQTPLYAITTSE